MHKDHFLVLYMQTTQMFKTVASTVYLVCRGKFCPWLISTPVIVLGTCDLHIFVKPQDFSGLQFSHSRPLTQLMGGNKKNFQYSFACKVKLLALKMNINGIFQLHWNES